MLPHSDSKPSLYNLIGEEEDTFLADGEKANPFHLSLGFGPFRSFGRSIQTSGPPLNGVELGFFL